MSKDENKKAVNYSDYTFAGDEKLTITAQEYVAMQKGIDRAIQNGVDVQHPQVLKFFDVKTGEPVENPTEKQITSGEVKQYADFEATKSEKNANVIYNGNLFPDVFEAKQTQMLIFQRHVDEGKVPTIAEVKKKFEDRKAEGQMKVVDDEDTD